jgi:hypothetical protein
MQRAELCTAGTHSQHPMPLTHLANRPPPAKPQIARCAAAPILHLRTVNPYLGASLGDGPGAARAAIARQTLPWSRTEAAVAQGRAGGISSFAFQVGRGS